jgi:hypothetical protein
MPLNRICRMCRGVLSRPNAPFCSKCGAVVPNQVEIFVSYAHQDETLREQLQYQLSVFQREELAFIWHDGLIFAGQELLRVVDAHLKTAEIILPLVSSNYVASDSCYNEMKIAVDRHLRKEVYLVPIIMRPVDWTHTPFRTFRALPKDGKPVNTWSNPDEAFLDVVRGIRATIEQVFV